MSERVEIEITRLDGNWVDGLMYDPKDEMHHHVRVGIENVLVAPSIPVCDNGSVFRPGVGITRKVGGPLLKVGDFVMVIMA